MSRRLRPAIDIISDIGCLAYDLQRHNDQDIGRAMAFMLKCNPAMFTWLIQVVASSQSAEKERP